MTDAIQGLVSAAKNNKFSTINSNLSDEDVVSVWDNVSAFIEKQMSQQKGVCIPGFGTFTFSQKKLDIGNNKFLLIQRPVFLLAEKFAQTHGLHHTKYHISGQIPVVQLNYSALSFDSPFDRDTVEACVKEVLGALQRSVSSKRNVEFSFSGIGRLQIRDSRVKMKFYKDFINNMDGSGKLVEALQDRPGTVDSVMTDRPISVRPNTSNTMILPRIGNQQSPVGDLVHQEMEPIAEEGEVADILKSVDGLLEQLKPTNAGEDKEVPVDVPVSYDVKEDDEARDSSTVRSTASLSGSRMAVPLPKATGVSFHDDLLPAALYSPRSLHSNVPLSTPSPAQFKRTLSPLNSPRSPRTHNISPPADGHSYSADGALRRPVLPASKPSPPAQERPKTGGSCGHSNAGQELCYLCHQRARRNIPISFAEERKRREQEEEALFQKYQQMKDQEAILQEQEQFVAKRHNNQKIAAFNLGVAEAVRMKKTAKDKDFHTSYVFQRRPLTPPKCLKQNKYLNDLKEQVQIRERVEKRRQADEEFLGRLEQVQLAEDLLAQREQYLKDKQEQQEQYKRALSAQLRFKPQPIPARVPDSSETVFGTNDIDNEKMMAKRKHAYELYKNQLATVEQRKRDAILQKLQEQREEEEMLKRAREELIADRAEKYERMFNTRKHLESDWFAALEAKKKREEEEREHAHSTGMLVHEQCDKYKRCAECKRGLTNCGESNIWRETRYISGSRLMV